MKAAWELTRLYVRRHWSQQLAFSVAICLFSTIILVTLFLCQCFSATNTQLAYEYYGSFGGQTLLAAPTTVSALQSQREGCGLSIIPTYGAMYTENQSVYLGYMDEAGRSMRAVRVKTGRAPQNSGEIAIDETAYFRLGLDAELGDSLEFVLHGPNGTESMDFILTGIYYDYADHWNKMAQDILLQVGEIGGTDPQLPAVLVGAPLDRDILSHTVLYPEGIAPIEGDTHYFPNFEAGSAENYAQQLNASSATALAFLGGFFFILSIMGIRLVSYMTWRNRYTFINSLTKIGITSGQMKKLYLVQALITSSLAWISSIPLSLLVLWFAVKSVSWQGTSIQLDISVLPVLLTGLLIIGATVFIFLLQLKGQKNTTKVLQKRKKVEPAGSISELWKKVEKLSIGGKKISILLLCLGCVFVTGFGLFSGETAAGTHFYTALEARGTVDYHIYVEQGAASLAMLNAGFPRDLGMTKAELAKLQSSSDIDFLCAYTDQLLLPAFLHITRNDVHNSEYIKWAESNSLEAKRNPYGDPDLKKVIEEARYRFGYKESDILVSDPPIVAVDLQTMKNLLESVSLEMTQEAQEQFVQGRTAYSSFMNLRKDEEIRITMPVIPPGSTSTELNGVGKSAEFSMRIAETVIFPQNVFGSSQVFPYGHETSPCIFISYEAVSEVDPQLGLFSVALNDRGTDYDSAKIAAHRSAAASKGMGISDRKENLANWSETLQRERLPIYILVAIFLLIMAGATWIINRLRIMEQIRSFSLLCVLGMTVRELKSRFIKDNLQIILNGEAVGLVLAIVADSYLILRYSYVPLLSLALKTVLPFTLAVCLLLICISYVSSSLAFRKVMKMTDLALAKNIID